VGFDGILHEGIVPIVEFHGILHEGIVPIVEFHGILRKGIVPIVEFHGIRLKVEDKRAIVEFDEVGIIMVCPTAADDANALRLPLLLAVIIDNEGVRNAIVHDETMFAHIEADAFDCRSSPSNVSCIGHIIYFVLVYDGLWI
jgi:hypothetical protein